VWGVIFGSKNAIGSSIRLGVRIENPHFWAKNRGASIDYLRFSIYDWVETLIFGRKTRVKPSIMSAMGLKISVFGRKIGVRLWKRLQTWKNMTKCCKRCDNTGEKVVRMVKKVVGKDTKKARRREKRGEIGYLS